MLKSKTSKKEKINIFKIDKSNYGFVYLTIILLGILFNILSCFHSNIWFDESYSIAISRHSFSEIFLIGSNDVHPILYYFMLRIIQLIFNESIMACRIFSCIPIIIMGILGYTHIRKDFGEKTGIYFTFLSMFMPTCLMYSGEIRMYTWAMLFVTIMSIYANRIMKNEFNLKDWIIFSIFSLCSAYTHYYALITAFIENITLFIIYGKRLFINKNKDSKKGFTTSVISAILQVIIYIPWLSALLGQTSNVSNGFWIDTPNPIKLIEFQFSGNLDSTIPRYISITFAFIILIYMIYIYIKNRKDLKAVKQAMIVYFSVIMITAIASIIMKQSILYSRYLLTITGLVIFSLSYLMAKDTSKKVVIVWILIVAISTICNISLINLNYDESNNKQIEFIKENIKDDDIIIINNSLNGFTLVTALNTENKVYFYNEEKWNVEEAYKAFKLEKTIEDLDEIKKDSNGKEISDRIITISSENFDLSKNVQEKLKYDKVLEEEKIKVKYEGYEYTITILEKDE